MLWSDFQDIFLRKNSNNKVGDNRGYLFELFVFQKVIFYLFIVPTQNQVCFFNVHG